MPGEARRNWKHPRRRQKLDRSTHAPRGFKPSHFALCKFRNLPLTLLYRGRHLIENSSATLSPRSHGCELLLISISSPRHLPVTALPLPSPLELSLRRRILCPHQVSWRRPGDILL